MLQLRHMSSKAVLLLSTLALAACGDDSSTSLDQGVIAPDHGAATDHYCGGGDDAICGGPLSATGLCAVDVCNGCGCNGTGIPGLTCSQVGCSPPDGGTGPRGLPWGRCGVDADCFGNVTCSYNRGCNSPLGWCNSDTYDCPAMRRDFSVCGCDGKNHNLTVNGCFPNIAYNHAGPC